MYIYIYIFIHTYIYIYIAPPGRPPASSGPSPPREYVLLPIRLIILL